MSDSDDFEDIIDEDISALEDNPAEDNLEGTGSIVRNAAIWGPIAPDTPVYRLRLAYSHETFLAVYGGEAGEVAKTLEPDAMVMVPTRFGRDLAQIIGLLQRNGPPPAGEIIRIERPASKEDLEKAAYNRKQEEEAFRVCKQKIREHRLDMKLVSVHYLLDEPKILFFFTAETRVDFRDLVKDLVGIFKTRVELRQIGVRDESRVVGGLGVCGRGYCCHAVSDKLKPVSIKMAKDQNLSLNSMKISGPCGRLLCCLAYEHCFYNEQRRLVPQEGCKIPYDDTLWKVVEVNVVAGILRLSAEEGRTMQLPSSAFEKADNRWRIKPGAAPETGK